MNGGRPQRAQLHGQWRLLGPAVVAWAAAALLIHFPGSGRLLAIGSAGIGSVLCLVWVLVLRRAGAPRTRIVGIALVGCAVLLGLGTRIDGIEGARSDPLLTGAAEAHGNVTMLTRVGGYPKPSSSIGGEDRSWVRAALFSVDGTPLERPSPAMLWLPGPPDDRWHPGARVLVTGSLVRGPPAELAAYEVRVSSLRYVGPASGIGRWTGPAAAALRASLHAVAAETAGAALVPGLAVGDTTLVSDDLDRVMRESSLSHLTAVSGSNCALVITAMTAAAKRLGLGRRMRILCGAAALGGFVIIVGPDASVQRAAIMAVVLLVSSYGGKRRHALPALGLATITLLIADPWQSIQPGFALSVTATAGILLWAAPLEAWLRSRVRLPRLLALPLAVAAVAQFACAPLLLLLQPGLPVGGVLANLLAAPAAPLGTGLGMIALLTLPVSASVGTCVLGIAVLPARWIEAAGAVSSSLPGARWYWPEGWPGAALLAGVYLVFGVAWAASSGWLRGSPPALRDGSGGWAPWRGRLRITATLRRLVWATAAIGAGVFLAVVVVVPGAVRLGVPDDWAVVACDVGQGDAILLRDPARPSEVMLVDTGDDPELLGACLDLFGVRRVALLVLTHDHMDHVGAMQLALARSDGALVAPPSAEGEGRLALADRVSRSGLPVTVGRAGVAGGVADSLVWEVLAPESGRQLATANATSLVLAVEVSGVRVVLLGDTGETEQRELATRHPALTTDIVKVAHHGSRDQVAGFYSTIGAQYGLVSSGEGNRYGHPNPALLADLAAAGTVPLRTDELGSIAIRLSPSGPEPWGAGARSAVMQ